MKRMFIGASVAFLLSVSDVRAEFLQMDLSIFGMD